MKKNYYQADSYATNIFGFIEAYLPKDFSEFKSNPKESRLAKVTKEFNPKDAFDSIDSSKLNNYKKIERKESS